MDKTHIPSGNKREARARFITVDAELHRKPSMATLLREGLQSLFHSPGTLQEEFLILLRRLDAHAKALAHTMFQMFRMRLTHRWTAPPRATFNDRCKRPKEMSRDEDRHQQDDRRRREDDDRRRHDDDRRRIQEDQRREQRRQDDLRRQQDRDEDSRRHRR